MTPLEWITVPLSYPFMQRALVVSILVAAVCAVLSCYLVLKGWSLMGDAISHAVLPGIVIAYVAGLPLALGAFTAGLLCAIATGFLKDNSRIKEDTAMGVVFSGDSWGMTLSPLSMPGRISECITELNPGVCGRWECEPSPDMTDSVSPSPIDNQNLFQAGPSSLFVFMVLTCSKVA